MKAQKAALASTLNSTGIAFQVQIVNSTTEWIHTSNLCSLISTKFGGLLFLSKALISISTPSNIYLLTTGKILGMILFNTSTKEYLSTSAKYVLANKRKQRNYTVMLRSSRTS